MKSPEIKKLENIIGLSPARASKVTNRVIRVIEEEGYPVTVSAEYRPSRVNVAIKAGKIVEVINLG